MNSIPREAHEAEMALRFLALANPPPVLFRYRSPNQWTLDEISKQQLYAPKSDELNDPFECHAAVFWDVESISYSTDTVSSFSHKRNTAGCSHKRKSRVQ
jgi:hypothetical protein